MSKIILKKSSVVDKVPLPGDLDYGELALNYADSKLFFKKADNTIGTIGGGNAAGSALQNRYSYTATASQTIFSAIYTAPYVDVYLNGLRLSSGVDYTATSGTSIVLTEAAAVNDLVEIVATNTYTVNPGFVLATTATPSTVVLRDTNGDFSASIITANLQGILLPDQNYNILAGSTWGTAEQSDSVVIGEEAFNLGVSQWGSISIGSYASSYKTYAVALGYSASVQATNSIAIGADITIAAAYTNSISIGYQSVVTAANQVVLGNTNITQTQLRGTVLIGNETALHTGNYNSYALPLSGGTLTGAVAFAGAQTWPTFNQNTTGNAATVTNGVYTTGAQSIAGTKTFSDTPIFSGGTTQVGSSAGVYRQFRYDGTISSDGSTFNALLHAGNYTSYSPGLTGTGASGTWGINITGSSANTSIVSSPDGDRVAGNKLPTTNARSVRFDFANASSVTGAAGNYAGVMTYAPWDGTSASTGDSSYQLAFTNQSGSNASGPPQLLIRNGINSTWNSWHTIITTASTQSAPRATRANGFFYIDDNFGVGVVGNYNAARYQTVYAMGDAYKMAADGATLANMYGIAWSHPNAGGAAGNLTDHGMLIINNGSFRCAISNSIVASGNITAYSDERLKTNWRDMPENFVARLAKVKVGIYDRIDTENGTQVGVSAQSFQELLPQAITTATDDMQTLSVNYGGAALASAVELAKDNCELRARIERLEALIHTILNKD